jgi:hypothetical protein
MKQLNFFMSKSYLQNDEQLRVAAILPKLPNERRAAHALILCIRVRRPKLSGQEGCGW